MPSDLIGIDVDEAVRRLRAGGVVAIPTETVYGLAADVTNAAAVERIFDIKDRPRGHPLILHVASAAEVDRWSDRPSAAALRLAHLAWPGPLTLLVPASSAVPSEVTGGRSSVGLRCPAHPLATELLQRLGTGLVAPSANRFGAVSPTTPEHVLDDLGDRLDPTMDMILDGPVVGASGPARASGMLPSHYAPRCEVRLVDTADDAHALRAGTPAASILDLTADVADYARRLYSELRSADERGVGTLIAVLPPAEGLGHAIRDRLSKAAAPRP
jgi:L-threonylcarbamoyladenylate synthase